MNTMYPPGYHYWLQTHALGHIMMYGSSCVHVHELPQSHWAIRKKAHIYKYMYIYTCIYKYI